MVIFFACSLFSIGAQAFQITPASQPQEGCFDLITDQIPVALFVDEGDNVGVVRAMNDFQADLERVSTQKPDLYTTDIPKEANILMAGTIGKSSFIDQLINEGRLDVSEVEGEWEAYVQQVIENPMPGIEKALVIAGSDKRGTIFGIYDLSREIGVSPWYWWADVPVQQKSNVKVLAGCKSTDKPKVQYRGIFLNDENPALLGWVTENYGGFNHEFYSEVFELMLRLKSNYLWTAMWGKAFYDDDSLNAQTANEYGIVIGTSHHEPMARAHVEWERYGEGAWNYQTNKERLQEFWRTGIERLKDYEATVSLGMRGDGDEAMSEDTNVELLQQIVEDQREIIDEISPENKDRQVQMWALYKEVQEYYEKGMRVPDDVMLLLADDNWGNVRLLPEPGTAEEHPGGWGMYYHFDYVGGPRNYKWINTNQVSRIWEQMNLTWEHGVDRMWLVNVGDLKPMEYPISFFLDQAWDPEAMTINKMESYPADWASYQFGKEHGQEIGELLAAYSKYNARRKPELLSPETYSLVHFNEADRIVNEYNTMAEQAEELNEKLPENQKDAFYQLVLFPIKASANLNELYVTAAKNQWYAQQGRALTNEMAEKVQALFDRDAELTDYYHNEMADGKWNHMMSQTHIGYTYWQQPEQNNMPEVAEIDLPKKAEMGISIPGSADWWPASENTAELLTFDAFNNQKQYIEIFNRGQNEFSFSVEKTADWLKLSKTTGTITTQQRVWVEIDWENVPEGMHTTNLTIQQEGGVSVQVGVKAQKLNPQMVSGFVESNGYISIEAPHFARKIDTESAEWKHVPNIGRTVSGMTPFPVTADTKVPGTAGSPSLEYDIHLTSPGEVKVKVYVSPTLDYYMNSDGLKYGVSFNDQEPELVNIHADYEWNTIVANYTNLTKSTHQLEESGNHVLKIWMADPGVVIQKIVIETGQVGETYLGPPESAKVD